MKRSELQIWLVWSLVIAFMTLGAASVWADVTHQNETIDTNTTWSAADNDHIVIGYVSVSSGVTLTVEDGCVVRFDQGARITVWGTLNAPGTSGTGILFTREDVADQWSGLQFNSGSSGILQYCTIEYANFYTTVLMQGSMHRLLLA